MSRSNPTPTNPAQHFFTWSGSKGQLEWYNKEKQMRVPVKIPFEFMVLDELATITGFCEQDTSSYWSNEVRNVTREELTVKTSRGTKQVGLYKDLADVRSKGAKYAKSIYIAHKIGDDYVIGNLKASGAALTAWIEFGNTCVPQNGKTRLTGSIEGKKGTNTYLIPVFEYDHISKKENDIALELDRDLQVYLSQYLSASQLDKANEPDEVIEPELATPEQVAEFERLKAQGTRNARMDLRPDPMERVFTVGRSATEPLPEYEEDQIDINDVPF